MASSSKLCVFCGSVATTKDHVPPKCIFPEDRRENLITVPACELCNSTTRKDDEYFRLIIAGVANDSSAAGEVLQYKILPGAEVRPGLLKKITGTMELIDFHTETGIYIGQKPAFTYEASRIHPVVSKIVKGLFYVRNSRTLAPEYEVDDFILQPDLPDETIEALNTLPLYSVDNEVFQYRYYSEPGRMDHSYWFLMFYKSVLFFSRTVSDAEV